ncbi:B12-binding domain-containing radical SAM protein [Chloroflexota bacterium]
MQPNVGFMGHTWEALGIGYLVAYLKKHFSGNLKIDFYSGFYDSDEKIINAAKGADIIGFSCTSPQYKHAFNLAKQIKTKNNWIVFGGVHSTALPQKVLEENCIDAVVIGEGEQAFLTLVKDVNQGINISHRKYQTTYISDVNDFPFPDRRAIKNERNLAQAYQDEGLRITSVLSSRGCPFHCSFCCSHNLWQNQTRFRSSSNILNEVEELVRDWDVQFLKFSDDTFTTNKQNVIDFCKLKIEKEIKIPYGANAHVNTVDEEILKYLVESGCRELWYGVESGSPRILQEMHKSTNIYKIKKAFKLTKEFGIKTRAYFLLGMPSETIEDIQMTERLCDELQPDIVGFTLLAPFPANEYFDYETMADWDWSQFDEYGNDWVRTKTLSNQELKDVQSRLVNKYQSLATFRQKVKQ